LLVRLEEALLRAGALVLDRLAIHVTEDELEEIPDAVQVATVDASNAHLRHGSDHGAQATRVALQCARTTREP